MHGLSVWVEQLPTINQPKGRWEDMLLTQPPLQRALVYTPWSNHYHLLRSDEGAAGITLGCRVKHRAERCSSGERRTSRKAQDIRLGVSHEETPQERAGKRAKPGASVDAVRVENEHG